MARGFPPTSVRAGSDRLFGVTEFEPLLDSDQAAKLLRIHPKTLQKMARRGEIHGIEGSGQWLVASVWRGCRCPEIWEFALSYVTIQPLATCH
jgi:Helix-turn-helix domain